MYQNPDMPFTPTRTTTVPYTVTTPTLSTTLSPIETSAGNVSRISTVTDSYTTDQARALTPLFLEPDVLELVHRHLPRTWEYNPAPEKSTSDNPVDRKQYLLDRVLDTSESSSLPPYSRFQNPETSQPFYDTSEITFRRPFPHTQTRASQASVEREVLPDPPTPHMHDCNPINTHCVFQPLRGSSSGVATYTTHPNNSIWRPTTTSLPPRSHADTQNTSHRVSVAPTPKYQEEVREGPLRLQPIVDEVGFQLSSRYDFGDRGKCVYGHDHVYEKPKG